MNVWTAAFTAAAGILGFVLGRLLARGQSERALGEAASLKARLDQSLADGKVLQQSLTEAEAARAVAESRSRDMSDSFKALASDALDANARKLLEMAEQRFKSVREESATDLEARRAAVEALVQPLSSALAKYQAEAATLEGRRQNELGSLGKQLEQLAAVQAALQGETRHLANALQSNTVRGRWGEVALRRIADLAGMTPHCDFVEQESREQEEGGRARPDMVIRLPGGREVILDAKVPLAGYLEAVQADTDKARKEALTRYAAAVRGRVDDLARKDYRAQFARSADFVVLFLPNDSFLAAAAEHAPDLIEYSMGRRVVIATPATLIALLTVVAQVWRQEQVSESAQRVWEVCMDLSDRVSTLYEHIAGVGDSLTQATTSYNKAVSSLDARLLPLARRLKEMGAAGKKDLPELPPVDQAPRRLPG